MTDLAIGNTGTHTAGLSGQMAAQKSADTAAQRLTSRQPAGLKKAAKEFEAVFISQMLSHMWSGIEVDGPFSGGRGEEIFRDMMVDEYGKQMADSGQFGLSDQIMAQLLQLQEQR